MNASFTYHRFLRLSRNRTGSRTSCSAGAVLVQFFLALVAVGLAGTAMKAHAQVLRCTDARTGKVTYTDSTCSTGQSVTEVEARKTPEQIALDRERAEEALKAKQERQAAEAEADARQLEREARERSLAPRPFMPEDYANSRGCADARANLNAATANLARTPEEQATRIDAAQQQLDYACLGPDGYARAQASRASQPPQVVVIQPPAYPIRPRPGWQGRPNQPLPADRPQIRECTSFTCTDTNGKRYPRTGRGSFEER